MSTPERGPELSPPAEVSYRMLFQHMLDEVHFWQLVRDKDGNIETWRLVDANPVALKSWGRTREEVVGRTADDFLPGATKHFMPIVEKIFTEGVPHVWVSYFPATNQTLRMTSVPFGEYFISTGSGLSQADEYSVRQQYYLTRAQEIASVGTWEIDLRRNELIWTEQNYRNFGVPPGTPLTFETFLGCVHPDDREYVKTEWLAATRGRPYDIEHRLMVDGHVRWVREKAEVTFDSDGTAAKAIGFTQDITQRKAAEADAARFSERLEIATRAGRVGIWEWNIVADTMFWDDTICDMYAIPHGSFREGYETWRRCLHPDDRDRIDLDIQAALRGEREYAPEFRLVWPDGSIRHIQANSQTFFDGNGQAVRMVGTNIDITEHRQAEAALKDSMALNESLLRAIPLGMDIVDQEGNILFQNDKIQQLSGTPAAGQKCWQLYRDHQERCEECPIRMPIQIGETRTLEVGQILGGRTFEIKHTGMTYQGKPALLEVFHDITERKRVEESRARLAVAVEAAAETIVITDVEGTIFYVNPMFETSSGYTAAEAIGKNPRILKSGKHDAQFYREMWATISGGDSWSGHLINKRKNGELYEEDATISPIRDGAGAITSYVAVKHDVTREIEMEAQLRQAQKMEAVGVLAGGVAHDFNNILAAMMLQMGLLKMDASDPGEVEEALESLEASANRARDLVQQLLFYSRRQALQARDVELNEVVDQFSKMIRRIIGEDVDVQLTLHPTPLVLHADSTMIERVLMNLALNARDAMPKGGTLTVQTSAVSLDAAAAQCVGAEAGPGDYVCLCVGDTGPGIPPEVLPKIFEPFFTTKDVGKGTGLGLSSVFGIIKQHRGGVEVDSRPGQGVTFKIFFPVGTVATQEAPAVQQTSAHRHGHETILYVEDEDALRKLTRRLLERHGYRVLEAANGKEALALWEKHRESVSLLLTDMVMPAGMNGLELARKLQAETPALTAVFVSGYSWETMVGLREQEAGLTFIQKPYTPDQLFMAIRNVLDKVAS